MMLLSRLRPSKNKSEAKTVAEAKETKKIPELNEYLDKRDYAGAISLLEFQRKSGKGDVDTDLWLAWAAFHAADYKRASEEYEKLVKNKKAPAEISAYLSVCLFFLGYYKEARDAAEKAPAKTPLKNRLLFHLSHKLGDEKALMTHHAQLQDVLEDQLCLASIHYLRSHYQEAIDIYKRILLNNRNFVALNVYLALCYYKLDYYDVSLEVLQVYLTQYPDSATALNLRACNHYKLYNGKAAEAELRTLQDQATAAFHYARDIINHNMVSLYLTQYPDSATALNLRACNHYKLYNGKAAEAEQRTLQDQATAAFHYARDIINHNMVSLYLTQYPDSATALNLRACNHYKLYNGKAAEAELRTLQDQATAAFHYARDIINHNMVSLYLTQYPDSATALNLRACNHYKLYNGKAAEAELRTLQDQATAAFHYARDIINHNMVSLYLTQYPDSATALNLRACNHYKLYNGKAAEAELRTLQDQATAAFHYARDIINHNMVSLYLTQYPDSATALNLRACNHYKLYNGKAAEAELRTLQDQATAAFHYARDIINHNMVSLYLTQYPDSATALNLRACNHYKLYNGKAAEAELRTLQDQATAAFHYARDIINHNMVSLYLTQYPDSATALNLRACNHYKLYNGKAAKAELRTLQDQATAAFHYARDIINHNMVSLYLTQYPDSATALNLRACNHYKLYNGKAAEAELRTLQDQATAAFHYARDIINHNMVSLYLTQYPDSATALNLRACNHYKLYNGKAAEAELRTLQDQATAAFHYARDIINHNMVSLYLTQYPDSATALNLRACNHYKLYNGKAAEAELRTLQDQATAAFHYARDIINHNMVSLYLTQYPDSATALNLRACNHYKLYNGKAAEAELRTLQDQATAAFHYARDIINHNMVSLYLTQYPDSATALNLRACNHYKLYNGKAAEAELRTLQDQATAAFHYARDIINHNMVSLYLTQYPDSATALNLRACNHYKLYNGKAAEAELRTLQDQATAAFHYARDIINHNMVSLYLTQYPDSATALNLRACNHYKLYNGKAAEAELRTLQDQATAAFHYARDIINHNMVSLYLTQYPDSATALNLRACNHYKLYNGKAAEAELRTLQDQATAAFHYARDIINHNMVVFRNGEAALQVLPPLVDVLPEARLNLVIYHLQKDDVKAAYELVKDMEPSIPQEYILKGVVFCLLGQQTLSKEHLKVAQEYFRFVGGSAAECDTIPGRQCMASAYFLMKQFEEVLVYFNSIKTYFYNDDTFNFNYGQTHCAVGNYAESEEVLLLVQREDLRGHYTYIATLARAYIMNKKAKLAWELYLRMEHSAESFSLLQLLANDCYKMGQFYYAAKAFDVLERLDPNPEYWDGKRGACAGVFQLVVAQQEPLDSLRDVISLLGNTSHPQVDALVRVMAKWLRENGG